MSKKIKYERKDGIVTKEEITTLVTENILLDVRKGNLLEEIKTLQLQIDEINEEITSINDFEKEL